MSYENRQVPEGINVSQEHPLKEFFWLTAAAIGIVVVVVVILSLSAEFLAPYVPFETEKSLSKIVTNQLTDPAPQAPEHMEIQHYLQSLSERLSAVQGLPNAMSITIHYVDSEVVNAMATLGGHILIYRGLLEKLPHENALSMVMAHEIAHIKHRDPLIALGRGVTFLMLFSALTGFGDTNLLDGLLGQAGMLTTLKFNRDQETAADREAIRTLENFYGHVSGADALFEILETAGDKTETPEFMRSHPHTEERINEIKAFQTTHGFNGDRSFTELPEVIQQIKATPKPKSKP